jgi:hypothetical protein
MSDSVSRASGSTIAPAILSQLIDIEENEGAEDAASSHPTYIDLATSIYDKAITLDTFSRTKMCTSLHKTMMGKSIGNREQGFHLQDSRNGGNACGRSCQVRPGLLVGNTLWRTDRRALFSETFVVFQ